MSWSRFRNKDIREKKPALKAPGKVRFLISTKAGGGNEQKKKTQKPHKPDILLDKSHNVLAGMEKKKSRRRKRG